MTRPRPAAVQRILWVGRQAWRRLTSMRTALILLFLLAVAAVPGSILPQRPLNPSKTSAYIAAHGRWGRLLDRLGAFDVFGSVWFAAIYLLLLVSLVGCLIPRIRLHIRNVARAPLPAPKRLARLPESALITATGDPAELAHRARAALGRRWRVRIRDEDSGAVTVSAEKGYLRESGNLLFHVALLIAVLAIAIDRLYYYEGMVIVQQGQGFCNTRLDLDSLRTGRLAADQPLAPLCVDRLDRFTATYTANGQATQFLANVTYSEGSTGAPHRTTISVNHPLRVDGDRIYLTGHGYAPRFTVRMPDGTTRTTTATFLPQDAMLTSEGVAKIQAARRGGDIGIEGIFAPDGVLNSRGLLTSGAAAPFHPQVAIFVYRGDLGLRNGNPQNVYTLDSRQIMTGALRQIGRATLNPGQSKTLPGGVRVTFDGYSQWVNLQISHNPAQDYLLLAALLMVLGLLASLTIRRRRLWLRITADTDIESESGAVSSVEIGGLARTDSGNFTDEFQALTTRLQTALQQPDRTATLQGADR